jgi:hypothetical protein
MASRKYLYMAVMVCVIIAITALLIERFYMVSPPSPSPQPQETPILIPTPFITPTPTHSPTPVSLEEIVPSK